MTTLCVAVRGHCLPTSNPGTESQLVALLRAGDDNAYEHLFRTHAEAMLAAARRFFGDTLDAAEAVQDAFVSAFKGIQSFEGTARLGTWLHRITINACLMKLRGRTGPRLVPLDEPAGPVASTEGDMLTRAETVGQVRAGIDKLPAAYRSVILLRDIEGLDTAEAAARLGTNETVVKTRLHRARLALRSLLAPEFRTAIEN
jgi:RNA polymerase sigma-70 factor, ECF subfamily